VKLKVHTTRIGGSVIFMYWRILSSKLSEAVFLLCSVRAASFDSSKRTCRRFASMLAE